MQARGELFGDRIVILDYREGRRIYEEGFYGKPLGVSKPKSTEEIKTPLELSLIEGLYLLRKGKIAVRYKGNDVDERELEDYAVKLIPRFRDLYRVYEDLKRRGFVVRSGIKFGADFAVYTLGPGVEHAPFVVSVVNADEEMNATELMSYGRVSHSTRKKLILAIINSSSNEIKYIMFKWVKM
jgi:tRNA-intron endonuclease